MPRKIQDVSLKPGTCGYDILQSLALCGEFPWSNLAELSPNSRRDRIVRVLRNMREHHYVSVLGSGDFRSIRLLAKGVDALSEDAREHYMAQTMGHKFVGAVQGENTRRLHRLAEIFCMMRDVGVSVWMGEKPALDAPIPPAGKYFYTSRELKATEERTRGKYGFTRIRGALLSPGGVYATYHTNKGMLRWQNYGEIKTQILLQDVLSRVYPMDVSAKNAIVFGKNIQLIVDILTNKKQEYLSMDNTFDHLHFLTLDDMGKRQLRLLSESQWRRHVQRLYPTEALQQEKYGIDCDARKGDTYMLGFLDGDLVRLQRFARAALQYPERVFELTVYPHQAPAIQAYAPHLQLRVLS